MHRGVFRVLADTFMPCQSGIACATGVYLDTPTVRATKFRENERETHLEVSLEPLRRALVVEDDVAQPVRQHALPHLRMRGQLRRHNPLHLAPPGCGH